MPPIVRLCAALRRRGGARLSAITAAAALAAAAFPPSAPAAGPVLAEDTFERHLDGAWGSAPTGGPWQSAAPAADLFVAGGAGRVVTPRGGRGERVVLLSEPQARDVDAQVTVDLPEVATQGGSLFAYALLRRQASGRYARVGLKATGGGRLELRAQSDRGTGLLPDAATGLPAAPGRHVLRVQIQGASPATIRAKAWAAGTAEPPAWQLLGETAGVPQEAGGLGVRTVAVGTADPLAVGFDDLQATALDPEPDSTEPPEDGEEPGTPADLTGERQVWHPLALTVDGPEASEAGEPNPFLAHRMDVTFRNGASAVRVPGFFAADGDAQDTGASSGRRWRANFTPDRPGTWTYEVSFRSGKDVAVDADPDAGSPVPGVDGLAGSFAVAPSDKTGRSHLAKGMLRYAGGHRLRFAGTGEHFLKVGANSPENLLAYADFDGTRPSHRYAAHVGDHRPGDPTWGGGRGKGLVGALSYLAGEGMNAVYFLTNTVGGDGRDVWPWTSSTARTRYDVSKLAQWDVVFSHMDRVGLLQHVVLQEMENDRLLDGGDLGTERRLYHRELVARFGHHLALQWNLGEENQNTTAQRRQFAAHLRDLDPYDHPIVVHNGGGWTPDALWGPLLGDPSFEGTSFQLGGGPATVHAETLTWTRRSAAAGRPWAVAVDELGPHADGVLPDRVDPRHDAPRKQALWGNLMAGGAGVEWYFGYEHEHDDLRMEDWRSRAAMWEQSRYAVEFFQRHLPFAAMRPADELTPARDDYVLAAPGRSYAVYLPDAAAPTLDLEGHAGPFRVRWYDPRAGGALQAGSRDVVQGPGRVALGTPPKGSGDWVALVD